MNVREAVLEVNRSGLAVEPKPLPIPQLEGEDVGRRADLQHDVVLAGAVNGAGRDREMVVLAAGPCAHMALDGKRRPAVLGGAPVSFEGLGGGAVLESEGDGRPRLRA